MDFYILWGAANRLIERMIERELFSIPVIVRSSTLYKFSLIAIASYVLYVTFTVDEYQE
jgi:hypothetical protein